MKYACYLEQLADGRMAVSRSPLAHRARRLVLDAVARGRLPAVDTLICVDCGGPATVYDHRDYAAPLDVQPVCDFCNRYRGPASLDAPIQDVLDRLSALAENGGNVWKASRAPRSA